MFDFCSFDFGLDIKRPNVSQAAKALRYLFIHDMRGITIFYFVFYKLLLFVLYLFHIATTAGLQTHINECIVAVQSLTANPKTDTKLGKVGY